MASMRGVPIIGPWQGKWMKIKQLWSVGCTVEPQIWMLGWVNALPTALWSLFGPDCKDMAYDRFKKKHKSKRTGIMNIAAQNEGIGPKGQMGWTLFRGAEFAQRVGWYMLIVDVGLEQLYLSASMAYKYQGCTDPNGAWCMLGMGSQLLEFPPPLEHTISSWGVLGQHIFGGSAVQVICPHGYDPSVGLSITQIPIGGGFPDCEVQFQIVETLSGFASPWMTPFDGPEGSKTVQHFAPEWGFFQTAKIFTVRFKKTAGWLWISSATLTVNGGPKIGLGSSFCANKPQRREQP